MKDHSFEAQVRELVGENKLEEAIDLLLSQKGQTSRRQNALLIIKSRLSSLEEQELAGMIAFDELSRQKAKIAHQVLDIADGSSLDEAASTPSNSSAKGGGSKYLLIGGTILLAAIALIFAWPKSGDEVVTDQSPEPKEEVRPQTPVSEEKTTAKVEKDDKAVEEKKEEPKQNTRRVAEEPPRKKEEEEKEREAQPAVVARKASIPSFPDYGRRILHRDLYVTYQKPVLTLMDDPTSPKVKMVLPLSIKCRNNLGYCEREKIMVLVGGKPYEPTRKTGGTTLNHGDTVEEELTFILPADAGSYQLSLSSGGTEPRIRGFKILVN